MGSIRSFALGAVVSLAALHLGCASDPQNDASASEEINATYADPGTQLGKATHVIADAVDDATFVVFDGALTRVTADAETQTITDVGAGFESLVVSKTRIAFLTSAIVSNSHRVLLHVLSRAEGWKEVLTEDFSADQAPYKHPLSFLDDDTLAVGNGEEIDVFAADGTKTKLAGYMSKFRADAVSKLYPAGDAGHVYALLDNGEIYLVDVPANTVELQPSFEGRERWPAPLTQIFEPVSKIWIATDFEGIKIYGTDGKLQRKVDLVTAKGRYISTAALLDEKTLLVANQSEKSQERHVLAKYSLADLTRTEIGTLKGMVGELAPGQSGRLFYTFSPSGAEGYNSRVYYGYARSL